jgi:hypothetical protein
MKNGFTLLCQKNDNSILIMAEDRNGRYIRLPSSVFCLPCLPQAGVSLAEKYLFTGQKEDKYKITKPIK